MRDMRRFERYDVRDMLFVHVEGYQFHTLGQVRDIGMRGISYEYIHDSLSHPENVEIEIFSSGRSFHLRKVPCRVVYNFPGTMERFSTVWTRVCGVRFLDLTSDQERALSAYLNSKLLSEMSHDLLRAVGGAERLTA